LYTHALFNVNNDFFSVVSLLVSAYVGDTF